MQSDENSLKSDQESFFETYFLTETGSACGKFAIRL